MGVAEQFEQDGGIYASTPIQDAALILDSIMGVITTQSPEDESERLQFWSTLVSGMGGMAAAALGDESAQTVFFLTLMSLKKGAVSGQ